MLWTAEEERERQARARIRQQPAGRRRPGLLLVAIVVPAVAAIVVAALAIGGGGLFGRSAPRAEGAAGTIARADRFDAGAALRIAKLQIDAGPRPAGSRALRRVAERLRAMLPDGRFEEVPAHPGLRNIVGSLPGPGPVIVIGAHYDTQPYPRGYLGANDAAAAVGAVIEIARAMKRVKRPAQAPGVRFVLFDGEESPLPNDGDFYRRALRGSRAYVGTHAEEVRELVLLDYIGGRNLQLPREANSAPGLWADVRRAATAAGYGRIFPDRVGAALYDDTTPFLEAGIPAVDLIDWSYPYEGRLSDTYDKLDVRSVDAVGETVLTWLLGADRRAAKAATPSS